MKDSGFHTLAYDHANAKPYLDGNAATVETRGTYGFDGWAESAAVEGVPKDRPLKVLMIGNSFSLSNFRQMPKVAARCRRM